MHGKWYFVTKICIDLSPEKVREKLASSLEAESVTDVTKLGDFHCSLSKSFVLKNYELQPFGKALTKSISGVGETFELSIVKNKFKVLAGKSTGLAYIVLEISESSQEHLNNLAGKATEVIQTSSFEGKTYHYFKNPIHHVSILSVKYDLEKVAELQEMCDKYGLKDDAPEKYIDITVSEVEFKAGDQIKQIRLIA